MDGDMALDSKALPPDSLAEDSSAKLSKAFDATAVKALPPHLRASRKAAKSTTTQPGSTASLSQLPPETATADHSMQKSLSPLTHAELPSSTIEPVNPEALQSQLAIGPETATAGQAALEVLPPVTHAEPGESTADKSNLKASPPQLQVTPEPSNADRMKPKGLPPHLRAKLAKSTAGEANQQALPPHMQKVSAIGPKALRPHQHVKPTSANVSEGRPEALSPHKPAKSVSKSVAQPRVGGAPVCRINSSDKGRGQANDSKSKLSEPKFQASSNVEVNSRDCEAIEHRNAMRKKDDDSARPTSDIKHSSGTGGTHVKQIPVAPRRRVPSAQPITSYVDVKSHIDQDRSFKRPPRQDRWPKPKDFPKPDPKRFVPKFCSSKKLNYSSSVDSASDGGWADEEKQHPTGVNSSGYRLTDWNGGWAPAPIDWDARPAFDGGKQTMQIENWVGDVERALEKDARSLSVDDVAVCTQELVPPYWVPRELANMSPQTFWNKNSEPRDPAPVDEGDLDSARPWWQLLQPVESSLNMALPHDHPNIKGIDPDEKLNERLARENDYGSAQHTKNRFRLEAAKQQARRNERRKGEEKAKKFEARHHGMRHEPIKPGIRLYVRVARPNDMPAIRDIHNYHIDSSCCTQETERCTETDMLQLYQKVKEHRLPFLVAYEQGMKLNRRRNRHVQGEELFLPDKLVGFAHADTYGNSEGIYKSTVDVKVYTDKQYLMKGVANCLMDKLIGMLDPEYAERGGFNLEGRELEEEGERRLVKNIVVNFLYDKPARLEWMTRWLTGWLGFERKGILEGIGEKDGERQVPPAVSTAIFQRKAGAAGGAASSRAVVVRPGFEEWRKAKLAGWSG
ncbi:hypothetical protein B0A50_07084 [Salinomyces thailandicus]|uniref:Uncharacterized protein n=1 Tax=Salinomyces thailandicus TaxID=706561 RepID=A0A4U0TPS1_9PEZI|nr:hypothetical protein B0A50_07084 [Salinomyces thailandica]